MVIMSLDWGSKALHVWAITYVGLVYDKLL